MQTGITREQWRDPFVLSIVNMLTREGDQNQASSEGQPKGLGLYSEYQTMCCNSLMCQK